ncbi:hypothetical protein [Fluviicola sp.]|uniref:hypothetical protein n=1 Tax=Fluviicola sp. TaxID=1917219 RepID=UPI00261A3A3D|nr:hypothetical protein [Fluviicola sp.]
MKFVVLILFIPVSVLCGAQGQFIREARCQLPRKDSLFAFRSDFAASGKYNYFSDSTEKIGLILNQLLKNANKNRADTLKQSLVLTDLATYCAKHIHSLMPVNPERKKRLEKRIRRIFFGSRCNFGLLETISFEIPLVKTKGQFHYNKKGPAGGYNLYKGKHKAKKTVENPEPEEIALEEYSYEEIQKHISNQLSRKKVYRYLSEKNIAAFGYSIELDQSTVQKNKIPQLKVLLILGEKRFSYKQRKSFNKKTSSVSE